MSKLFLEQKVPYQYDRQVFSDIIRAICGQVNPLSEGKLNARYNAQASVPSGTAVAYAVGDVVYDSNATVRASVAPGLAASYVRIGWMNTAPGTPGTFVELRILTGT